MGVHERAIHLDQRFNIPFAQAKPRQIGIRFDLGIGNSLRATFGIYPRARKRVKHIPKVIEPDWNGRDRWHWCAISAVLL